uniref:Uncharacterized protein n=1 Tax=Sphaerodactylus townsendi TaxID=933632 RepID=A0ACB8ERR8_9SAUR
MLYQRGNEWHIHGTTDLISTIQQEILLWEPDAKCTRLPCIIFHRVFCGRTSQWIVPMTFTAYSRRILLPFFVIYFIHGNERLLKWRLKLPLIDCCIKILSKFGCLADL